MLRWHTPTSNVQSANQIPFTWAKDYAPDHKAFETNSNKTASPEGPHCYKGSMAGQEWLQDGKHTEQQVGF